MYRQLVAVCHNVTQLKAKLQKFDKAGGAGARAVSQFLASVLHGALKIQGDDPEQPPLGFEAPVHLSHAVIKLVDDLKMIHQGRQLTTVKTAAAVALAAAATAQDTANDAVAFGLELEDRRVSDMLYMREEHAQLRLEIAAQAAQAAQLQAVSPRAAFVFRVSSIVNSRSRFFGRV